MTETNFSNFGQSFQEKLAKILFYDRTFCDQLLEVLDDEFFEFKYLQSFVFLLRDHKTKYKSHPSLDAFETILRVDLENYSDHLRDDIKDFFFKNIKTENLSLEDDAEFIKEKSLDFCRKQKLKEAMIKSIDLLEKSSYDDIAGVINGALSLGADNNLGHDYKEDLEDRFKDELRFPIGTGWKLMDDIMKGGPAPGDLAVCIAPTGRGKSHCLVSIGTAALKQGKNVAHFTLELSEILIGCRYDSCLTKIKSEELKLFKEEIKVAADDLRGRLKIKFYPTKSVTTQTIRNQLERMRLRGFVPDLVIVDYGDLLKPSTSWKEKRDGLESIYEDLRAIASEFNVVMWTASQTNRDGAKEEVITLESIADAYSKCFVADFVFSLSRTVEQKKSNQGLFFIAKSRLGPDGIIFPIYMNTSNTQIDVRRAEEGEGTISDQIKKNDKETAARVKETYKQWKKDR